MAANSTEIDTESLRDPIQILPSGIIAEILSFLSPEDVAGRCALLSKGWYDAASDHRVWQNFCGVTEVSAADAATYTGGWKFFFVLAFRSNLVKSPKFEDFNLREGNGNQPVWKKQGSLQVESPPVGCTLYPGYVPGDSVIATSYTLGSVSQFLDIRHLPASFLDSSPPIVISAWHGCRFDCESVFELKVDLRDDSEAVLKSYSSGRLPGVLNTWERAEYLLSDYPLGVRSISIRLSGQDSRFWAGHYGPKFGPVDIRFVPRHQVPDLLQLPPVAEGSGWRQYISDEDRDYDDEPSDEWDDDGYDDADVEEDVDDDGTDDASNLLSPVRI